MCLIAIAHSLRYGPWEFGMTEASARPVGTVLSALRSCRLRVILVCR